MSGGDDWQKGDLALCLRSALMTRRGAIYTVRDVGVGMGELRLWFDEWWHDELHRDVGSRSVRFRKINPLTDEERDEFLADLNAPVREPRHA